MAHVFIWRLRPETCFRLLNCEISPSCSYPVKSWKNIVRFHEDTLILLNSSISKCDRSTILWISAALLLKKVISSLDKGTKIVWNTSGVISPRLYVIIVRRIVCLIPFFAVKADMRFAIWIACFPSMLVLSDVSKGTWVFLHNVYQQVTI